jgi:hypothetical protein
MIHNYKKCKCGGSLTISNWDIDDAIKQGKTQAFCELCQTSIWVTKEEIEKWRHEKVFVKGDNINGN